MSNMDRRSIAQALNDIEQDMRALEIKYEQYFGGVEKREPYVAKEDLARRLRQFYNRRITYADLRFRHQSLSTRFQSYKGYWDRILRLMDEGKFTRGKSSLAVAGKPKAAAKSAPDNGKKDKAAPASNRAMQEKMVKAFIAKNKDKIKEKFGDRRVEFKVRMKDGKPTISVRPKD